MCPAVFFSQGSSRCRSSAGTTSRSGSPCGPVPCTTAERPTETWASSVAIGCRVRYVHVVEGPVRRAEATWSPLATAVSPAGAVIRKVKTALSAGWSLQGNTRWAASAWLAMARPSSVGTHPPSPRPRGSLVCRTVMRSAPPSATARGGVRTRSSPTLSNRAGSPLTSADATLPWVKSRLMRSSGSSARASMTVTASSGVRLSL